MVLEEDTRSIEASSLSKPSCALPCLGREARSIEVSFQLFGSFLIPFPFLFGKRLAFGKRLVTLRSRRLRAFSRLFFLEAPGGRPGPGPAEPAGRQGPHGRRPLHGPGNQIQKPFVAFVDSLHRKEGVRLFMF